MEAALTFAIIGFVELVKRINEKDWYTVVIIAGSAFIGWFIAPVYTPGATGLEGVLLGLSASGVITGASYIGKK